MIQELLTFTHLITGAWYLDSRGSSIGCVGAARSFSTMLTAVHGMRPTAIVCSSVVRPRCRAPRCVREDLAPEIMSALDLKPASALRLGTPEPDDMPGVVELLTECFYKEDSLTLASDASLSAHRATWHTHLVFPRARSSLWNAQKEFLCNEMRAKISFVMKFAIGLPL